MSTWTKNTPEGTSLTIEDSLETDNVCVIIGPAERHLHILKHDRREAAQALAGDEWGVIPAAEAAAPDGALSLIADVLGTDDLGDVLPGVERLKREVEKLRQHRDELRQRISDNAHARLHEAAQPDRPEPVSHFDVRPGDRVEVEHDGPPSWRWEAVAESPADEDGLWLSFHPGGTLLVPYDATVHILQPAERQRQERMVPAPVDPASVRVGDIVEIKAPLWRIEGECIGHPDEDHLGIQVDRARSVKVTDATVHILHAAEPEVDEAAVEALAEALHAAWASRAGLDHGWLQTGYQRQFLAQAAILIRDHGVRQEVPDAE